ncbi:ShlB/FhaC/HecB family hemolysin secretion/activation protein [Spirulina subsalsa]|uniref:ShlB/FhaC/HecB family hemolysin secretion/activation protein n=1 Tax=Spirulina subsalsa TaxID=54311 RepID=UPI00031122E4|nr:ShlB/FhaC/HecB family hemolysin secretion/activation protein [Spirulina subsalsa]
MLKQALRTTLLLTGVACPLVYGALGENAIAQAPHQPPTIQQPSFILPCPVPSEFCSSLSSSLPPHNPLPEGFLESNWLEFSPLSSLSVPSSPSPSNPLQITQNNIPIEGISVLGSTLFSDQDFAPLINPYIGQSISAETLTKIADSITDLYIERGYITSRAVVNSETISTGKIEIIVFEGGIEAIEIEGNQRLLDQYLRSRIAVGTQPPLNLRKLEDQLKLLRLNPLIENIEVQLTPGSNPFQYILRARVTEDKQYFGEVGANNQSPPTIGSEQIFGNFRHLNLTGRGDQLFLGYNRTWQGGSNQLGFNYSLPVNPMEGTLSLGVNLDWQRAVSGILQQFNAEGRSQRYSIGFRQPLRRTSTEEFALSLGFEVFNEQTFLSGRPFSFGAPTNADGKVRTRVLTFAQDYLRRDQAGAWLLRSEFRLGADWFDATKSNVSGVADGQFLSWLGQVRRVQRVGDNHLFLVSADLQLASQPLLPSELFPVGGARSVRGFRQNVRAGDNGLRFSVEDRITVLRDEGGNATLLVVPFVDLGWVWNNSQNVFPLGNQNFIAGVGGGILWNPIDNLEIRLEYGYPLVNLRDRGRNAQDDGLYFSVNYRF